MKGSELCLQNFTIELYSSQVEFTPRVFPKFPFALLQFCLILRRCSCLLCIPTKIVYAFLISSSMLHFTRRFQTEFIFEISV